jgi:hypothetical protein
MGPVGFEDAAMNVIEGVFFFAHMKNEDRG